MSPADDLPPDPRLQAALRHAPDRDLGAPPELSARILAQARAQARSAGGDGAPGWAARAWGWLSRPVAAGALGSVLVAGLVGLLWREGPPADNLASTDPPAPAAAPVAAPAPSPVAGPVTAPAVDPRPPASNVVPASRERQAAPAAEPAARLAKAVPPAGKRTAAETPPASPAADAAVPPVTVARAPAAARPAAPPPPSPSPSPSPPPAPPSPAPIAEAAVAGAPAPPAAAERQLGRSAPAPQAPRPERREAATAAVGAAAAFDPLVPPLLALRSPADEALRRRLQALQRRLAGPWVDATAPAGDWGERLRSADGTELGQLQVDATSVLWRGRDDLVWRAPLRPDPPAR